MNRDLLNGLSLRTAAKRYGLGVSSLGVHLRKHVKKPAAALVLQSVKHKAKEITRTVNAILDHAAAALEELDTMKSELAEARTRADEYDSEDKDKAFTGLLKVIEKRGDYIRGAAILAKAGFFNPVAHSKEDSELIPVDKIDADRLRGTI